MPPRAWVISHFVAAALSALVISAFCAALWLTCRRCIGAMVAPSPRTLVTVALVVAGGAALVRGAWARIRRTVARDARWERFEQSLLSATVVLTALALTFTTAPPVALALLWAAVVGEEALCWSRRSTRVGGSASAPPSAASEMAAPSEAGSALASDSGEASPGDGLPIRREVDELSSGETLEAESDGEEPILPADVDQQVTRHGGNGGNAWLEGIYRVRFVAGARSTELHLAFCPPWETVPALEIQVLDGTPAQCRVGQVETFGGRLELRRSGPADQAAETIIYVMARPTATNVAPVTGPIAVNSPQSP